MPKAFEKAKAKFQAVLDAESDHTHRTNRVGTTRHPSTGGCDITNTIEHRRRPSEGGLMARLKKVNSYPAY